MSLHNSHFYHGIIRKYVVSFGNLLNNIHVVRYAADGTQDFSEKVPMAYGPKEKWLYRNEQNPSLNERIAIKLPRISFELTEIKYDPTRKIPSNYKLRNSEAETGNADYMYTPVPYLFAFDAFFMGKSSDECLQMVEQITPFFTPDHTLTIRPIDGLDLVLDIPIVMDSVKVSDNWDGKYNERREIIWNLNFTLNGYLFPPLKTSKIILESDWNILDMNSGFVLEEGTETEK